MQQVSKGRRYVCTYACMYVHYLNVFNHDCCPKMLRGIMFLCIVIFRLEIFRNVFFSSFMNFFVLGAICIMLQDIQDMYIVIAY